MLKLVTQFDDNRAKPSLATPTCCCCCCCIVTTAVSSIITARNVINAVKIQHNEGKIKDEKLVASKWIYGTLGFFALPLVILLGVSLAIRWATSTAIDYISDEAMAFYVIVISIAAYISVFGFLRYKLRLSRLSIILTISLSLVFLVVEFFIWVGLILGNASFWNAIF